VSSADRGVALASGLWLVAVLSAFWGVTVFARAPENRLPIYADSIPPPADSAQLPPVPPGPIRIRLGFAGDLMQHMEQRRDDFQRSYSLVAPYLRGLDLAVANLEFPVDSTLPPGPDPGTFRFNGSPTHLDAIASAGFDVLQTANNHTNDRGPIGALRTLAAIRSRGMQAVGTAPTRDSLAATPLLVAVNGVRIAFRAYTIPPNTYLAADGTPEWPSRDLPLDALDFAHWRSDTRAYGHQLFRDHVLQARRLGADLVVGLVHWGREFYLAPSDDQRAAAHDLVDAGYDLIVGTHSHVLVPTEVYRGTLIAYSLGNFLSRGLSLETSVGGVLEVDVVGGRGRAAVERFRFRPTYVRPPGHVIVPADSAKGAADAAAWNVARRVLGGAVVPWRPEAPR
jgi:poly-gamma-glutamate synthesis protein (capsule biosynthesis protein)